MYRRFAEWANGHVLILVVVIVGIFFVVVTASFQHYNDANVARAVQEAKERAAALAQANQETCQRAVIAVTNQSKTDDLKLIKQIEDRFTEQGRPVPAGYIAAELAVANRQPPTAACVPKESP